MKYDVQKKKLWQESTDFLNDPRRINQHLFFTKSTSLIQVVNNWDFTGEIVPSPVLKTALMVYAISLMELAQCVLKVIKEHCAIEVSVFPYNRTNNKLHIVYNNDILQISKLI